MPYALTRAVSPTLPQCQLTHLARQPIDVDLARRQHEAYEDALRAAGYQVIQLPSPADLPDAVFIEDTALVFEEVAIITRPGAASRRPETAAVAVALAEHRKLDLIQAPATLDGGDVLRLGRTLFVGQGRRSNAAALAQLQALLAPWGYQVVGVPVQHCLHLKTAVSQVDDHTLLLNPRWVDSSYFPGWQLIPVAEEEPYAANALMLHDRLIFPAEYPRTAQRLAAAGLHVVPVPMSEFAKAEGGVTCCSLIW